MLPSNQSLLICLFITGRGINENNIPENILLIHAMSTHSPELSPPFAYAYFCRKTFYKANVITRQLLPFCVREGKSYSKLPNPTKRLTLSRKPFYIKWSIKKEHVTKETGQSSSSNSYNGRNQIHKREKIWACQPSLHLHNHSFLN